MFTIKSMLLSASGLAMTLGLGAFSFSTPTVSFQDDGTSKFGEESLSGSYEPAAVEPFALIGKASSFTSSSFPNGIETIVQVYNDDTVSRTVHVEWYYRAGGPDQLAGISGPFTISPGQSRTFGTHNSGDPDDPFIVNVFRDTTQDFVGRAKVFSDPGGFSGLTVQAFQVSGQGTGAFNGPENVETLRAYKIKSSSGSARQAGD